MATAKDLLDEAERLVEAEGFAALSVRRLADAVGESRQVVYTHFGGMDGLLDGLHLRGSQALFQAVARTPGERGSLDHALRTSLAYCKAAREHPALFELCFARPVPAYQPSDEARAGSLRGFAALVELAAAWLTATGRAAAPARATELARVLWSTTHGHVVLERAGFLDPREADGLVTKAVAAVFAGWPRA